MKILHQINYLGGLGADRWIGSGLKDAFEKLGHEFFWYTSTDSLVKRIEEVSPKIVITSQSELANDEKLEAFLAARKQGVKIVLRVDSFFDRDPKILKALSEHDPADLYYGEIEDPWMDNFKKKTGHSYRIIANAAHHRQNTPGQFSKKYECDIVFLGAMMPNKKAALKMLLLPLKKKYRVKIYGPNWTIKDNLMRLTALASRRIGLMNINQWISQLRLSVPTEEEKDMYASAKISVNIHERGENIKSHVILNERTFKIPASGGFEICDFVPPLRRYFTKEEMVMADDKNGDWVRDWFEKIDYYLHHHEEREKIRARGTTRARRDHTYLNRVKEIMTLLNL